MDITITWGRQIVELVLKVLKRKWNFNHVMNKMRKGRNGIECCNAYLQSHAIGKNKNLGIVK